MCVERPGGDVRAAAAAGFTLIEMMITVAVVALLAAVAYPTYTNSVLKSRRAEAKSALTEAAQRLERYYTENNTYAGARFCASGSAGCSASTQVFADYSENRYYALTIPDATRSATRYVAIAAPQGAQTRDVCGSLTLNEKGERGIGSDATESDWRKCW